MSFQHGAICLILFFFLRFSEQMSNKEYKTAVIEIEGEYEMIHQLLQKGDIRALRDDRNDGFFEKYNEVYLHEERESLTVKLYYKLRGLELLITSKILVVPSDEFIKSNPDHPSLFNFTFIPKPRMVATYQVNMEAVKEVSQKSEKNPLVMLCQLPDLDPKVVKYLLDNGLDVNGKNSKNFTAIFVAAGSGNLPVVKFLVEHGANVDLKIAHVPSSNFAESLPEFMTLFYENGVGELRDVLIPLTPILAAILEKHANVVEYLAGKSANLAKDKDEHWVMLFFPSATGEYDLLECLLRHGVDANAKDVLGQTVMHRAAMVGRLQVLKLLQRYHGNLKARDRFGWTPLHAATLFATNNSRPLLQFLLDQGADVNATTDGGFSPLGLLEAGLDYDFLTYLRKHYPLQYQAKHRLQPVNSDEGRLDNLQLLLDRGADVNHQDDLLGWTPLHWAAALGDLKAVRVLVKNGANVSIKSEMAFSPSETAAYFGMTDVVEYLNTVNIRQ